jgi:hypothetical protein
MEETGGEQRGIPGHGKHDSMPGCGCTVPGAQGVITPAVQEWPASHSACPVRMVGGPSRGVVAWPGDTVSCPKPRGQ